MVFELTGIASPDGYRLIDSDAYGGSRLGELWRHYRGRLLLGMALDFSEAAGYYGLFTAMSIFVFSSATGAVPISDQALPYYFLIANLGALAGGILVAYALDRAGRGPTVTVAYTAAALSMLRLRRGSRNRLGNRRARCFHDRCLLRHLRMGLGLPDILRAVSDAPACHGDRRLRGVWVAREQ